MKNDYNSRQYAVNLINRSGECIDYIIFSASTFYNEEGNVDITCLSVTDFGSIIQRNVELKVQNKVLNELWDASTTAVSFYNTPRKSDYYTTFTNNFERERAYNWVYEKGTIPSSITDSTKFFIFNADNNKTGYFMKNNTNEVFNCKWKKMRTEQQDLLVIYKDGVLFVPYYALCKNFIGYCRYYERETQSSQAIYGGGNIKYRWGIKAMVKIDVEKLKAEKKTDDGMYWFELDNIPSEVFGNNR